MLPVSTRMTAHTHTHPHTHTHSHRYAHTHTHNFCSVWQAVGNKNSQASQRISEPVLWIYTQPHTSDLLSHWNHAAVGDLTNPCHRGHLQVESIGNFQA